MRALSLWQSWLAGVLHGDGYCTAKGIGLYVKDVEFAKEFADSLDVIYERRVGSFLDKRGLWMTRSSNKAGIFDEAKGFSPISLEEKAMWVRGLFDSEGNAQLMKYKQWENSYHRRVAMYSTLMPTLLMAQEYLSDLGIATKIYTTKNSATHIGPKTVYELKLKSGMGNFSKFSTMVGSCIPRKQKSLEKIVFTYCDDLPTMCRAAQSKGAATKRMKRENVTLPLIIKEIKNLQNSGIKPTQRECSKIKGHASVLNLMRHSELMKLVEATV